MSKTPGCTKCGLILEGHESEFYLAPKGRGGYRSECKACWRARNASYFKKNEAGIKSNVRKWKQANPQNVLDSNNKSRYKLRFSLLSHYSKGKMVCACCGEDHIEFLTIDHVNGGGNAHRRSIGNGRTASGDVFYYWLRDNNYPPGFQVLCHNCNHAKTACGGCPHQRIILKEEI
jgi:hypothetical protein